MTTVLIAAIVKSGINVYKKGKYPHNVNAGGFPSATMESLSFLHSEYFEGLCFLLGASAKEVLEKNDIPAKDEDCQCEECKTDYSSECELMGNGYQPGVNRKHYVVWKNKRMVHIEPQ